MSAHKAQISLCSVLPLSAIFCKLYSEARAPRVVITSAAGALHYCLIEMRVAALCLAALLAVADALSAPATAAAKAKRVLVPIADGTEEIEVVTVVDVLRRAGAEVVLASVEDDDRTAVTCSRGVKIEADCHVKAVTGRQGGKEGWDLIAIPGGAPDQRLMHNSVAQWIAYQTSNLGVAGSSPVGVVGRYAQFPLDRHAGR